MKVTPTKVQSTDKAPALSGTPAQVIKSAALEIVDAVDLAGDLTFNDDAALYIATLLSRMGAELNMVIQTQRMERAGWRVERTDDRLKKARKRFK